MVEQSLTNDVHGSTVTSIHQGSPLTSFFHYACRFTTGELAHARKYTQIARKNMKTYEKLGEHMNVRLCVCIYVCVEQVNERTPTREMPHTG